MLGECQSFYLQTSLEELVRYIKSRASSTPSGESASLRIPKCLRFSRCARSVTVNQIRSVTWTAVSASAAERFAPRTKFYAFMKWFVRADRSFCYRLACFGFCRQFVLPSSKLPFPDFLSYCKQLPL